MWLHWLPLHARGCTCCSCTINDALGCTARNDPPLGATQQKCKHGGVTCKNSWPARENAVFGISFYTHPIALERLFCRACVGVPASAAPSHNPTRQRGRTAFQL